MFMVSVPMNLFYMIHYCHFEICDMFNTDVDSLNVFSITEVGD